MNDSTARSPCLIDADNVSADVIEQAIQRTLAEHGAIHVRRAYCNAETAVKQQALFKRLLDPADGEPVDRQELAPTSRWRSMRSIS